MLPDRSILTGQKLVEIVKIDKLKCDILGDFQTLWVKSKINGAKSYLTVRWRLLFVDIFVKFEVSFVHFSDFSTLLTHFSFMIHETLSEFLVVVMMVLLFRISFEF